MIERIQGRTPLHANIAPNKENWISTTAGKSGLSYSYVIRMKDAQVELYIGTGEEEENKKIFERLYACKDEVEKRFGSLLDRQRLDDKRASRVRYVIERLGLENKENWPELQEQMVEAMIRLSNAFKLEINRL